MKSEKFLNMLSGIDSELVENARKDIAVWEESREGVSFIPEPRKSNRKMIAASAAGVAAAAVGAVVLMSNIGNIRLSENPGQYGVGAASGEIVDSSGENEITDSLNESEAADCTAGGDSEQNEITAAPQQTATLPLIMTEIMRWDSDLVYDVLGDGYPFFTEERSYDFDPDYTQTLWCDKDENGVTRLYLDNSPARIYYHSPNGPDHLSYFSLYETYYKNTFDVDFSDVLDGFSKEDAIQRARETAEKFGITNLGEPSVFALTAEEANAYSEREIERYGYDEYKFGPYIPWTKDDEAYYITFPLMYGETPLVPYQVAINKVGLAGEKSTFLGAYVKVIVTKDKIVAFDAMEISKPEYTVGEPVNINFSKEDIMKKVAAINPHGDPSGPETFYDCKLVYVPVQNTDTGLVFAPAWQVDYGTSFSYIDSVTGETVFGEPHRTVVYSAETGEFIDSHPNHFIEKAATDELTDARPDNYIG